jgi:glycosyltransferase involved in cell wall biosynthesis
MPGRIPCSVHMLTRNSAATLGAALESVSDFAEIIISDGGSTDATRAIAAKYGCRVVDQDSRHTDGAGRLVDFAGARSQLVPLSSYDWFLYLDSDEVLTPEAAATIADVFSGSVPAEIGAYRLRPKHVVNGTTIQDGSKSNWREARLFRRSALQHFVGRLDEHVELLSGYVLQDLEAVFLKPLPPVRRLIPKWAHYLRVYALEAAAKGPEWTDRQLPRRKSSVRYLIRDWSKARRRHHPDRMPFRYEAAQVLFEAGAYGTLRLVRLSQRRHGRRDSSAHTR